jgi:hypothetical protein
MGLNVLDEFYNRGLISNIELPRNTVDLRRHRYSRVSLDIGDNDFDSIPGKAPTQRAAYAVPTTCDNRDADGR